MMECMHCTAMQCTAKPCTDRGSGTTGGRRKTTAYTHVRPSVRHGRACLRFLSERDMSGTRDELAARRAKGDRTRTCIISVPTQTEVYTYVSIYTQYTTTYNKFSRYRAQRVRTHVRTREQSAGPGSLSVHACMCTYRTVRVRSEETCCRSTSLCRLQEQIDRNE
jgi:hypothetical protein